jgi:hypothetical protein
LLQFLLRRTYRVCLCITYKHFLFSQDALHKYANNPFFFLNDGILMFRFLMHKNKIKKRNAFKIISTYVFHLNFILFYYYYFLKQVLMYVIYWRIDNLCSLSINYGEDIFYSIIMNHFNASFINNNRIKKNYNSYVIYEQKHKLISINHKNCDKSFLEKYKKRLSLCNSCIMNLNGLE